MQTGPNFYHTFWLLRVFLAIKNVKNETKITQNELVRRVTRLPCFQQWWEEKRIDGCFTGALKKQRFSIHIWRRFAVLDPARIFLKKAYLLISFLACFFAWHIAKLC